MRVNATVGSEVRGKGLEGEVYRMKELIMARMKVEVVVERGVG